MNISFRLLKSFTKISDFHFSSTPYFMERFQSNSCMHKLYSNKIICASCKFFEVFINLDIFIITSFMYMGNQWWHLIYPKSSCMSHQSTPVCPISVPITLCIYFAHDFPTQIALLVHCYLIDAWLQALCAKSIQHWLCDISYCLLGRF